MVSERTRERLEAINNQLLSPSAPPPAATVPPSTTAAPTRPLPVIRTVAGPSNGPRVPGKVVIITGANSPMGIGRASAHQFAANGARAIYICDFSDAYLSAHVGELNRLYPDVDVHARRIDAADEEAVKGVVEEALEKYGRLDVVFANAGIVGTNQRFGDISSDAFMETMRVNVLR
jgi:hypothetical protein